MIQNMQSKIGGAVPNDLLQDIEALTATERDLFKQFGGGYAKDGLLSDEAKKRKILDHSEALRMTYGAESMALENLYGSQALKHYGGDTEMASAIMPYIAAGLLPDLQKLFHSQYESQQDILRQIEQQIQAGERPGAKEILNAYVSPTQSILENPIYQPSLSSRYQYDSGVELKQKTLTFEEMFEKKPEKDDWQIVVNINGQEATAELRKNGSGVKSIDGIVNDIKTKNTYRRNPFYIEKPR